MNPLIFFIYFSRAGKSSVLDNQLLMNKTAVKIVDPKVLLKRQLLKTKLLNIPKQGGNRFQLALDALGTVKSSDIIDFGVTTIANNLFVHDKTQLFSEQYKDFLISHNKAIVYFEVGRLLHNEQYEQASLLAIEEFEKLSKVETIDVKLLPLYLRFFNILEMASKRNDSIITLKLLGILHKHDLLHDINYLQVFNKALEASNDELLVELFQYLENLELSDDALKLYAHHLIKKEEHDKVLLIISKMKSDDYKNVVTLEYLSSLDFKQCFILLDQLYEGGFVKLPDLMDIPTHLMSIANLDDYCVIQEYVSALKEIKSTEVQQMAFYALLKSIDNRAHLGSIIFLLNSIINGVKFDVKTSLQHEHVDIIFHTISNGRFKLAGINLMKFFKNNGYEISFKNYHRLLRPQWFGTEHETVYYVLIQALMDHNTLSNDIITFLEKMFEQTNDNRLRFFIERLWEKESIEAVKEKVDYDFIERNLEIERERIKENTSLLKGFGSYDYKADIVLVDFLNR